MVIRYIITFLMAYSISTSFAEGVSVIEKLKSGYSYNIAGVSGQAQLDFPTRADFTAPKDFGMTLIDSSENVTLADFSMGMNCKTGAINISASIPELNSFSDAMKVFAPFAVDPSTGEVDFGNFISSLMEEFAMEKITEETLNYLAYIHYYITGSMSDNPPADLMMFKSKEYKECLNQTFLSSIEETQSVGVSTVSHDDYESHLGLDVPQLIKKAYCAFKFTGVSVGEDERERFNKSKAFVRAIFYKLLNGNFDFKLAQSEQCRQLDQAAKAIETLYNKLNKESIQRSLGGDTLGLDGTRTETILDVDSVTTYAVTAGTDGSIDPRPGNENANPAESKIKVKDSGGIMTTGSQQTKTKFDFLTKIVFVPSSLFMDRVDLTVDERYSFFDNTFNDFERSIQDSSLYNDMSTQSRKSVVTLIKKILTIQQLNHKNLNKLECAINKNGCSSYKYITGPEYNRVVVNGGAVSECTQTKKIGDRVICVSEKAIEDTMYKGFKDAKTVSDDKIRLYMNKLVSDTMFYYVYVYLQSHYGLIFKEEFSFKGYDGDDPKGINKMEYVSLKVGALRHAAIISKYWTSPISLSSENDSLKQDLLDLQILTKSGQAIKRSTFVKIVSRILRNTAKEPEKEALSLSFAPYIYEPVNELQLAKILYYLSDSLNIRKILSDSSPMELSVSIPGFYDYGEQYGPIINDLRSSKIIGSINHSTNGVSSPFKPIEINGVKVNQFLYQSVNSSRALLSIEELNNVVKMVDSFKDFYIKRLLDVYKEKYNNVSSIVLDYLTAGSHLNEARVRDMKYEVKKLSFRMLQRREMLRLLINE